MSPFPVVSILLFAAITVSTTGVHAQASEASALSSLPIGVISAAPAVLLSAGASLTVSAVEGSAAGTTWVLERAADGARASIKLSGKASVAVGTSVVVAATATGYVLSAAGQAIAFVPNELGASLLYDERVSR
jgi:hypothetical protein